MLFLLKRSSCFARAISCFAIAVSLPAFGAEAATCKTNLKPFLDSLQVTALAAGIVKNGELVCASAAGPVDNAISVPAAAAKLRKCRVMCRFLPFTAC